MTLSNWNYDVSIQTNESTHNWPITEWIYWLMNYCLLPPVNHHQLADLFPFHNYNDRLRLTNQKPNTNYIASQQNVWNVEIANLPTQNPILLIVNISASTQFMNLKLCEFICIVILYVHAKYWANLRYSQKFDEQVFNVS